VWINTKLSLYVNRKNDIIVKARYGVKYLGVWIYPNGLKLIKRNQKRAIEKLDKSNISSYSSMISRYHKKQEKNFDFHVLEVLEG